MNVVQLPQRRCAVAAMSHAMAPRHWGSRPGLTKRRRRSAATATTAVAANQVCIMWMQPSCNWVGSSAPSISLFYVVPESHMVCDCELTRLECRCATDDGTDDTDNVPLAAHIFISSTTATATAACNNNSQLAAASACISGHIPLPCTFPCSCESKQIVQILLLHLKTN